ncbi:uncharacterized protein C8Q71DRAFT_197276 [Rhodofomes roseus]|uniref:Uncharacterized protein n=1 Tax=Rhodofomes roseus TaxID=34475 RepID=A0ABQ8K7P7_9APHY|nr:uncharacterized protein C8Q71DRAFT_197276 [Rhodofomes roseus]KAH9833307.1 hypothetical protein C8Q71DRAFT_197276 [Rhodofomes roseus]
MSAATDSLCVLLLGVSAWLNLIQSIALICSDAVVLWSALALPRPAGKMHSATHTIEDIAAAIADRLNHTLSSVDREPLIEQLETIRRLARELPVSSSTRETLATEAQKLSDIARDVVVVYDNDNDNDDDEDDDNDDDDDADDEDVATIDEEVASIDEEDSQPEAWAIQAPVSRVQAQNIADQLQPIITSLEAACACCYAPKDTDDVIQTVRILQEGMGLPLPIPWHIIELAEYWVRSVGSCGTLTVGAFDSTIQEELCCSVRIPLHVKSYKPLRRVVFTIEAHDQGWCNSIDDGSWTWFEADSQAAWRRVIVRNPPASGRFHTYRIQWDLSLPSDIEVDTQLHEWLGRFPAGEELSVFARAQFGAWQNFVRKVVVESYSACV